MTPEQVVAIRLKPKKRLGGPRSLEDHICVFGFGTWELVAIVVVTLVVLGPAMIPRLGRRVADMVVGFRKAADELQDSIKTEEGQGDTSHQLSDGVEPGAVESATVVASDRQKAS